MYFSIMWKFMWIYHEWDIKIESRINYNSNFFKENQSKLKDVLKLLEKYIKISILILIYIFNFKFLWR